MQKGNTVLIVIILIAIGAVGYFLFNKENNKLADSLDPESGKPLVNGMPVPEGSVMEDGTVEEMIVSKDTSDSVEATAGTYEAYSPARIALAEKGKVVLFFYASWCPYCRLADNDINKNLSDIPKDVYILKTDYDKEKALKQKYGVTYQHTFVQVDGSGNLLKKWSGSESLSQILTNIK
ncbi:MAG: thioredoxin family protein [Patescibacteria group bacterium]